MDFFDCHCHSHFSLLDGLDSPGTLVKRAKEIGLSGLSLTDHGSLSGHRDMLKAGIEHDFKIALGVEAYLSTSNDRFDRRSKSRREDGNGVYHHLIILAKNDRGLQNLQNIMSLAWTESFVERWPIIDLELLGQYKDDLIVTSACVSGPISKNFELGHIDRAIKWALDLKGMFGDDFYIELQDHNDSITAGLNGFLLNTADKHEIKSIITTDTHFARAEDRWIEDALLILNTGLKPRKDADLSKSMKMDFMERYNYLYPGRVMSFEKIDVFLQTAPQLHAKMEKHGIYRTDIYTNTMEILDKIGN